MLKVEDLELSKLGKELQSQSVDHSLLSNGLDFVHSAVEFITDKEPGKVKYAILHLYSGTLLVLKERIHEEHWSLLFQRADKASLPKFSSGDFESIGYERILHVLEEVCQIKLEPGSVKALDDLRKIRNKVEHFQFEISVPTIKPTVAKVLSFLISFIEENLNPEHLESVERELLSEIKEMSRQFKEYVKERRVYVVQYSEKNGKDLFHCPECFEAALVREDDDFKCFVCNKEGADAVDVATTHLEYKFGLDSYSAAKDGTELPQHECPECSEFALVPEEKDYKNFICVSCGEKIPTKHLQNCSRCERIFYSKDEDQCCPECWADLIKD